MSEPNPYAVPLDALVATARVDRDDQVEEQDVRDLDDDRSEGHLPGGVRPYGA